MLINTRSDLLGDSFASQSPKKILYTSFSKGDSGIIILLILEFFTTALADGFPLESEWQ